jgi:heat shock protein HtpX
MVTLALVPGELSGRPPRYSASGDTVEIELHLPSPHPGLAVRVAIQGSLDDILRLQRELNRGVNRRQSGQLIAGMLLLLAVCGWIVGGDDGVRGAVTSGTTAWDAFEISPETMKRRFGAELLLPADMPALFARLEEICRRARLPRLPDLYHLPARFTMNAYAVGTAERSAIVLTQGLLERMTAAEVGGILAHEVGHIRNNDAWAMTWATGLQRAVAAISLAALAFAGGRRAAGGPGAALAVFLSTAPAVGQLLYLALSRMRELDADALALELIDDPQSLVSALRKLDAFHSGTQLPFYAAQEDGMIRLLRSHPATSERVGQLLRLSR